MSESTPTLDPTQSPDPTGQQGDPANPPLGEGGEKALKAERERASTFEKQAKELQRQLDAINQANESAIEKAQREAKEAQEAALVASTEALRFRVAAKHGISDEDASLFLTGADMETIERQAARLVERTPSGPRPDPSQGGSGDPAPGTPAQQFADFIHNMP